MKFTFHKYPSIENLPAITEQVITNAKTFPNVAIVEKIDGANIGLYISSDDYKIARRQAFIEDGENFFNIHNNVQMIKPVIEAVQKHLTEINAQKEFKEYEVTSYIVLYGEYFGRKVMNRIDYGVDYGFRFFGLNFVLVDSDGKEYPSISGWEDFFRFMGECGLLHWIAPVLTVTSAEKALSYPPDEKSKVAPDATMEGVVIHPIVRNFVKFTLYKNKSSEFLEHMTTKKLKAPKMPVDSTLITYKEAFTSYCTENRMHTVFSKLGCPADGVKSAGTYIAEFLDDAWQDFVKDYPDAADLQKNDQRYVRNIGKIPFQMFHSVHSTIHD